MTKVGHGPQTCYPSRIMMKRETFEIARIYLPVKRRATLEPSRVEALAQSNKQRPLTRRLTAFGATLSHKGRGFKRGFARAPE